MEGGTGMLRDITLGQYFPGDTVAHRLDPRTKLALVVLYIVGLFMAKNWISYGLVFLVTIACMAVSHIKLKTLTKGLKPLIIIIVLTAVLNLFYTPGTQIIEGVPMTWEGLKKAFLLVMRIMMLISGTFLLTYTTSPIALTDGLEKAMSPLKKLRFPVHEMSMMMSMALRFIPTLTEETDKIMSAQKARGADELAIAMESRCYHGGEGRTRMKQLKYAARDFIAYFLGILFVVVMAVLRHYGL